MKNTQYIITDYVNVFDELEYYVTDLETGRDVAGPFALPQDAKAELLRLLGLENQPSGAEMVAKDGRRYWK